VYLQGYRGFESLSLRKENQEDSERHAGGGPKESTAPFAPSFAPPVDAATLEAAIARLTIALATAADDDIPELVAERRALREELHALRQGNADVFDEQAICADVVDLNAKRRP
jgi:hypothetical protein